MGMKLYGMSMSYNTLRSTAALNEKGLDFEFSLVDLRSGAHKQLPFLALNPFGQIPVLKDGDTILFESRAINRYIATKYKETGVDLLPADISAAAAVEVWLEVESQQFGNPAGDLVFQLLISPMVGGTTDQAVVEKQSEKLAKVLDVYEARLGENKYLAGGEFTLVDLNHLPCMYLLQKTSKADLITARPHVNAWFEDISSRPAWKKTAAGIPL